MTIKSTDTFIVHKVNNTYAWIQVLHGDDEGLRLSVPLYSESYSDELTDSIKKHLNTNAIVNATVERPTDEPNGWQLTELNPTAIASI